jgi:hypothetical protein
MARIKGENRIDIPYFSYMIIVMKIFTSSLLFLFTVISFLFVGGLNLHAGASNKNGNPFGNGTFFNTTGTFTGVLRGQDLVGVTQFSTTTNASLTGGSVVIYDASRGLYNDGLGVYATLDPAANTLTAVILANTNNALSPNDTTDNTSANVFQGGGSFSASLSTQPPNQTYSGNGVITQVLSVNSPTTNPPLNMPFAITGTRISN